MITSTLIDATRALASPGNPIFVSTTNGASGGTGQVNAITTIALCNIGAPNLIDETVNAAKVNIWFARAGVGYQNYNRIVSDLIIPAGETVFFSEERIVLDANDTIYVGADVADLIAVTVSSLPV
jgi:hypothetical protein